MPRKKIKRIEIIGRWVDVGNKIIKYENIPENTKCTKCNGTDRFCIVCHGKSCEPELKWHQFIKKLKKWLE